MISKLQPLDQKLLKSLDKGRGWLEENLQLVEEASKPLEVALVALALHLMQSKLAEKAFAILARNARQESKPIYILKRLIVQVDNYYTEKD